VWAAQVICAETVAAIKRICAETVARLGPFAQVKAPFDLHPVVRNL